ncbi:MAG: hypothetical protein ABSA86_13170, partial [Oryzomonas sp.]
DPEMVVPSTQDFWGLWQAGNGLALSATVGSVAGNRCVISAPNVLIDKPKYGNRENILTADLPLEFQPTSNGNDEISLLFN